MVRLVADDLTGALDSGVQFTGIAKLCVPLAIGASDMDGSLALNLSCRDGSRETAIEATTVTLGYLDGADIAFKKIDSLLRGHWPAEIATLARSGRFGSIILAPAFPAQGRITRAGRQYWRSLDGSWQPVRVDICDALARECLTVGCGPGTHRPGNVLVCDAETQDDLAAVVVECHALARPILWCGAAGLARALAGAPPRRAPTRRGAHLTLIGSHHPVLRAQLSRLEVVSSHFVVRCGPDHERNAQHIGASLAAHERCVARADLPDGLDPVVAAVRIAAWLQGTLHFVPRPEVLTVIGGETLASVCHALQVTGLGLEGELGAGVPCSSLQGGPWDGVLCYSKSGAFGENDWLRAHVGWPATPPI